MGKAVSKQDASQHLFEEIHPAQPEYSKRQLQVLREHLKSFAKYQPSRVQDVQLVAFHWDQLHMIHAQPIDQTTGVAPIMKLFDVFYRFLFELAPDTVPLFHDSAQFQGRALMNIVGGIRSLLRNPNMLEVAAGIAHRHVTYGVKCEHFNPFGIALMRTLEALAPTLWTTLVGEAWHRVYAHVSVLVLDRLKQEAHGQIKQQDDPVPVQEPIQQAYSKKELQLLHEHLKYFANFQPSRNQDIELVTFHWDQLQVVHAQPIDQTTGVAPIMKLFDVFYHFLFELAPDTVPLFHDSAQFQGRALMNIVGGIRSLLRNPNLLEVAAGIAHRHVTYGVKCEHFNPFGIALVRTLEALAPSLWTRQICEAWHRVYAHVSVHVLGRLKQEMYDRRPRIKKIVVISSTSDNNPSTTTVATSNDVSENTNCKPAKDSSFPVVSN